MRETLVPLFSRSEIAEANRRLAGLLLNDFQKEEIVFICILKGSFMFISDLIRHIPNPVIVDFIRVSSYGSGMASSGKITITKDLETDIWDKNVVIVEDIIDSGRTLRQIRDMLLARKPRKLKICALIDKRARRVVEIEGDYVGFTIDDGFIVGYGIDYAERYRNLPEICLLEKRE